MWSTFTFVTAAVLLSASQALADPIPHPAAASATPIQYKTMIYQGCYSSGDGMTSNVSYIYQTKGYCQTVCVPLNQPVLATSGSTDCYCGNVLPPASSKVDDSSCNSPCAGYSTEMCGGIGFFSVYLDGLTTSAPNSDATPSSSTTGGSSSTTSAKPSVVTVGGQTIVVTATGSASTTASSKSGGPSKAGIAAGVVVGIVAICAIAGGVFLFMRNKKRREVEEEYRKNAAINSFISNGKPTSSAGQSSLTDTRLDPVVFAQRRVSDGSIADNQDYSRRILKVTNA